MIAAGLALAAGLAFGVETSTRTTLSPVVDLERQATLVEMRERRIVATNSEYWRPEDMATLQRLRRAEARGAFSVLREEVGSLRGFVAEHRSPDGRKLWLTKLGFERFQFLRSQKARQFFEEQGVDAKFIFKLKDPLGKKLFTAKGILTPEGDDLFDRASNGLRVRWTDASGKLVSSGTPLPAPDE